MSLPSPIPAESRVVPAPRSLLVVISRDPTQSASSLEGLRVAAGVQAWRQVRVRLCLWGEAATSCWRWALSEPHPAASGYLEAFAEAGGSICADQRVAQDRLPNLTAANWEHADTAELRKLSRACDTTIHFT